MPKKAEQGAPAYMAQFTALMTILLAFFICLQSVGAQRVSKYNMTGIGAIRDAFSYGGGMGVMAFMKSLMPRYPDVKVEEGQPEALFLGYPQGAFESDVIDDAAVIRWEILDLGHDIRIVTPVVFDDGDMALNNDARKFLGKLGSVFYNIPQTTITVCCLSSTGNAENDEVLAARRAGVVARFLEEDCDIRSERLNVVGTAHRNYVNVTKPVRADQFVLFLIRRTAAGTPRS